MGLLNCSNAAPINMLCREGYDADPITGRFNRDFDLQLQAEILLSDATIADERLAGRHPDFIKRQPRVDA